MQMLDMPDRAEGGRIGADLAAALGIPPDVAEAVMRAARAEFDRQLERLSLSRGGLADLIAVLGRANASHPLRTRAWEQEGEHAAGGKLLELVFLSDAKRASAAARIAQRTGVDARQIGAALPVLAEATLASIAARAKSSFGELLCRMPSLGAQSLGNPYADLSDIVRRGCGAGPYASRALRRLARRALLQAAGLPGGGALGWYARFLVGRPAGGALRMSRDALWRA
jgi:hypothetical protein